MAVIQCYGRRTSIRAVQMDKLRGLLSIRRIYSILKAWIRELCRVMKGVDKRIDEGVLQWFSHMERDMIAKEVNVGEYAVSHSVGRPWMRWIDTMKDCFRIRGVDVRQARRMVQDRRQWQVFVRVNAWGVAWVMNPRPCWDPTVVGSHSNMKSVGGNLSMAKPTT